MSTPWTKVDWSAAHPSPEQLRQSQELIRFAAVPVEAPAVLAVVDVLRPLLINGGAHAAAFNVTESDDTAAWFLSRNRFDEYGFVDCLLTSRALAEALPEVVAGGVNRTAGFTGHTPLTLDGEIAAALTWGGAYEEFPGTAAQAKALGRAFSDELIGDRYDDVRVACSYQRWSPWFRGLAWDATWLITDLRHRRITMLCLTDVD